MRTERAFTLIELLVAIAILSVIALASWQMLNGILKAREQADTKVRSLDSLQRAMHLMVSDWQQLADRPVSDELGGDVAALLTPLDGGVEFTRTGQFSGVRQSRSELLRVRYQLRNEVLHRFSWSSLDRAPGARPRDLELLTGVTAFEPRFLDSAGQWRTTWPPVTTGNGDVAKSVLPTVVELKITTRGFGDLRRLIRLPAGGSDEAP